MQVTSILSFSHTFFNSLLSGLCSKLDNSFKHCRLEQICLEIMKIIIKQRYYALPNNKFLDWSQLKAFADDKIKVTEKMKFVWEMVETIVGRGENAGYQHFLLFPQYFQKTSFSRLLKVGLCGNEIQEGQDGPGSLT